MSLFKSLLLLFFFASCTNAQQKASESAITIKEPHRPQVHFTPQKAWMNDPNGMVYHNGVYHLFYQYYPDSTVWGPMHWGHATSRDLVHWEHQPIALYPDSLGYIFSGSAVVDSTNTSGFGKGGSVPLVSIFTQHDPKGEKAGTATFQTQSIAYSLDEGKTWTKYAGNPVIKNPGQRDFRDPKVSWYGEEKKWVMTLATGDHVTFYSSSDLKTWKKEGEFGKEIGAHGGVWECPDLFPMICEGKRFWVLLVSINPGAPNGGSATQYFVGDFDGHRFKPFQTDTRWVDYGPDDYAGVTWSNTGERRIFLGWMSNWQYATLVPTAKWRSAMTVPRELQLQKIGEKYLLSSMPVKSLEAITLPADSLAINKKNKLSGPSKLLMKLGNAASFTITLANEAGQKVMIGYDKASNNYFIDRRESGSVAFEKGFAAKHTAPRLSNKEDMNLTLLIDDASVELFADDGLTVMTEIFFPDKNYSTITVEAGDGLKIDSLSLGRLKSIYGNGGVAVN